MAPNHDAASKVEPADLSSPATAAGPSSGQEPALPMTPQGRLWKPRLMGVNGEPFIVGLPPVINRVGAATAITYVCERVTLTIMIDFEPEKGAFPREIQLLKKAVTTSYGVEKGRVEFRDGIDCAIRQYSESDTSADAVNEIGRLQQAWGRIAASQGMEIPEYGFFYQDEREEHKRFPIDGLAVGWAGSGIDREVLGNEGAGGDVRAPRQPPQAEPGKWEAVYPLPVGKMIVSNEDWTFVSFGSVRDLPLGGQAQKILKALYRLGAVSGETAVSCEAIMKNAGIKSNITVAKPFSAGGKNNIYLKKLFDICVSNAEKRSGYPGRYYLTQPSGDAR